MTHAEVGNTTNNTLFIDGDTSYIIRIDDLVLHIGAQYRWVHKKTGGRICLPPEIIECIRKGENGTLVFQHPEMQREIELSGAFEVIMVKTVWVEIQKK